MCPIAVNAAPLMTRYLVEERRAFADSPLVIVDVGARAGVNVEWAVFGDQARVYCFEPDEAECARLTADAPSHVVYIPIALGATSGPATLYESRLAFSTSLYKTRMEYFGRFTNRDNAEIVAQHTVAVQSLRDAMKTYGIPQFDFIKLDAEGAELDILRGGVEAVASSDLLGVLSEIRLHQEINGSPPFSSLDIFLQGLGFRLYDLSINHHSRTALPYPQLSDYRLSSGKRFYAYTTHGQLQDGDALYFRDLFGETNREPLAILKICALMEIYSLGDCAAELIVANRDALAPLADPERLLDLLAAGLPGGEAGYRGYLDAYFAETPPPAPTVQTPEPDATTQEPPAEEGSANGNGRCDAIRGEEAGLIRRIGRHLFGRKA